MTVNHINKTNFNAEVMGSEQPVLLDFWAPWCGPCKMLSPVLDQIAQERPDIKVCKVNVDEEMELAQRYRVMSIPTLVVLDGGKVTGKAVGFRNKEEILKLISQK